MRTLFLDPFSGISGDMVLGLMVDLGVDPQSIQTALAKLPLQGYTLTWQRDSRNGIAGTRCVVQVTPGQPHRTWADIDAMLADSSLPQAATELARRIFRRIGEAEARVHGVSLKEVHFHEIGAVDSIVDIVGAALAWQLLDQPRVVCAPLPLTRGFVGCAHGNYPLPAPATVEILAGCPVISDKIEVELVTPTGAAIAAEMGEFGSWPQMRILKTGYGVGGRHLTDRPNLLRGCLGEVQDRTATDRVEILETHLDDANPEWLGALMEDLLQHGALDAAFAPLQMKKNRPGVRVTVIAACGEGEKFAQMLLRLSSAIGVRRQLCERFKLEREIRTIETEAGPAQVKLLSDAEKLLRITPEYESCRKLAQASERPLPEIYRLVERAAEQLYQVNPIDSDRDTRESP